MKVINVRINDHELKALNTGAGLSRIIDNVFLKIYHSNYVEEKKL